MLAISKNERFIGPAFIFLASFFWSFSGLLIKLVPWNAMCITGLRSLLAAGVLVVYMRGFRIVINKTVLLAAVFMSLTSITFVFANKLTTSANAIVLQYYAPMVVVIVTALINKKMPSARSMIATVSVFAGIALLFLDKLGSGALLGNITALVSGFCFAMMFVVNRLPGARPTDSLIIGNLINTVTGIPFYIMALTGAASAVSAASVTSAANAGMAGVSGPAAAAVVSGAAVSAGTAAAGGIAAGVGPWLAILALGIFQLGFGHVCFTIGISRTPSISASLISTVEPILNPIWVFIFIGERPGTWAMVGIFIVLASVIAYYLTESGQIDAKVKAEA